MTILAAVWLAMIVGIASFLAGVCLGFKGGQHWACVDATMDELVRIAAENARSTGNSCVDITHKEGKTP